MLCNYNTGIIGYKYVILFWGCCFLYFLLCKGLTRHLKEMNKHWAEEAKTGYEDSKSNP